MNGFCDHCPAKAAGLTTCLGQHHRRVCEHAKTDANWQAVVAKTKVKPPPAIKTFKPASRGKIGVGMAQPGLWLGGAERYHLDLWRLLPDAYHVVGTAVLVDSTASPLYSAYEQIGPVASGEDAIRELADTADILIVWGLPMLDQILGSAPHRAKLVVVGHGRCNWTAAAMQHVLRPDAAMAVLVSEDARRHVLPENYFGPMRVCPGMADPARVVPLLTREEQRAKWGVPNDAHVALHVARPSSEKHPERIYRNLPDDWWYVSVGTCPHEDTVKNDAKKTASGPVVFAGATDDVGSAMHAADCFVLPSSDEGCSLAALECHLAGLPIIATPVGLYSDQQGLVLLLPIDPTPEDVRTALRRSLDKESVAGMVSIAKQYVQQYHSPEAFRACWSGVLSHVAGQIYNGPAAQANHKPGVAYPPGVNPPPDGPGTEAAKMIARAHAILGPIRGIFEKIAPSFAKALDFRASAGCGCGSLRQQMDQWGVEGCRKHREEIVAKLYEQAKSHHLPGSYTLAEHLVDRAIRRAEKNLRTANSD